MTYPDWSLHLYEPLVGTAMQRVTQFDIYLLGRIQGLANLKAGDALAPHRVELGQVWYILQGFCNNQDNLIRLPHSVEEAKILQAEINVLGGEAAGHGPSRGILLEGQQELCSRLLIAFETTLRQECVIFQHTSSSATGYIMLMIWCRERTSVLRPLYNLICRIMLRAT
jgi:hypothetical protein